MRTQRRRKPLDIELARPFRREGTSDGFRATYRVTEVPRGGCVQVTIKLAVRIQLQQEISRRGITYTEELLGEITKELVREYVEGGRPLDASCSADPSPAFPIGYVDFDQLAEAAEKTAE